MAQLLLVLGALGGLARAQTSPQIDIVSCTSYSGLRAEWGDTDGVSEKVIDGDTSTYYSATWVDRFVCDLGAIYALEEAQLWQLHNFDYWWGDESGIFVTDSDAIFTFGDAATCATFHSDDIAGSAWTRLPCTTPVSGRYVWFFAGAPADVRLRPGEFAVYGDLVVPSPSPSAAPSGSAPPSGTPAPSGTPVPPPTTAAPSSCETTNCFDPTRFSFSNEVAYGEFPPFTAFLAARELPPCDERWTRSSGAWLSEDLWPFDPTDDCVAWGTQGVLPLAADFKTWPSRHPIKDGLFFSVCEGVDRSTAYVEAVEALDDAGDRDALFQTYVDEIHPFGDMVDFLWATGYHDAKDDALDCSYEHRDDCSYGGPYTDVLRENATAYAAERGVAVTTAQIERAFRAAAYYGQLYHVADRESRGLETDVKYGVPDWFDAARADDYAARAAALFLKLAEVYASWPWTYSTTATQNGQYGAFAPYFGMDSALFMSGPYWEHDDLLQGRYSQLSVCLGEAWDWISPALDAADVRAVEDGFWHEFLWTQSKVRLTISNGYSGEYSNRAQLGIVLDDPVLYQFGADLYGAFSKHGYYNDGSFTEGAYATAVCPQQMGYLDELAAIPYAAPDGFLNPFTGAAYAWADGSNNPFVTLRRFSSRCHLRRRSGVCRVMPPGAQRKKQHTQRGAPKVARDAETLVP